MRELLDNAARYHSPADPPIRVRAGANDRTFELEIIEPKKSVPETGTWGVQPFTDAEPGRYGLGTWAVRRWASAIGARLYRRYDENQLALVPRLTFALYRDPADPER